MSPRTTGSDPEEEAAPEPEVEAEAAAPADDEDVPLVQRQMNEVMEATAVVEEPPVPFYPPGAEELNAENVRRYPDLFTDEQKASIPNEELPLTDVEKAQAAAAEAEADS